MNPIKQRLYTYESTNKETRISYSAVERKESIISIEHLSNEILYEIFDYLDGCQLYEAFSNLNIRFQNLLINPYLLLKINLCSNEPMIIEHNCLNIINSNKSHIISLNLSSTTASKYFPKFIIINSLFNHLQSLAINGIAEYTLQLLLGQLIYLPYFYSLIISAVGSLESFDIIYRSIFRLPFLKYNKLSYGPWKVPVKLPFARNEQFSSIKYLNIDIDIAFNELISILSYTPQIHHLTCRYLFNTSLDINREIIFTLPNLTHINMNKCRLQFVEFEIFIKLISFKLQVLRFTTFENIDFLDADRWQTLILQYIPQLRIFEFAYEENISNNFQLDLHHNNIKQFTSSFWKERKWYFQLEIDSSSSINNRIIYLIHSYKKKWYHLSQYSKEVPNSPASNFEDIELNAINSCDFERYKYFINNINCIFQIVRITYLKIDLCYSSVDLLIDFISRLPYLNSLSVSCLPLLELNNLINEISTFYLVSNNNNIKKVNLENMGAFEQVQFLIDLCPHIEYLQVGCTSDFNSEMFKRFILMKNNSKKIFKLYSLCLDVPTADEKMIEKFQTMIHLERLIYDYSIKRVLDKIYFQWK